MPGAIATVPKLRFTDSSGTPFVGGTLTIYAAGTTTPANTWQDRALTTLNTNPIELDGDGACVVWLDDALSYKIVLKNSAGVTQWTQDNIEGGDLGDAIELAAPAIQAATDQAEGFADDAEASRDAIDNRIYPGTAASDPTTRPDGSAIQNGDIYINTTLGAKQRVSGAWVVMTAASSADLANNSDAAKGAALVGFRSATVANALTQYFPLAAATEAELLAARARAVAAGGGIVILPDATITLTASIPADPWVQYIGVPPRINQGVIPDNPWTFTGGTVLVGDGTFPAFAGNTTPAGSPAAGAAYGNGGIVGFGLESIGFSNFSKAVAIGATNVAGLLYGRLCNLWARECTDWSFDLINIMHSPVDRLFACVSSGIAGHGIRIRSDQPTSSLISGNLTADRLYVFQGNLTGRGIVFDCATGAKLNEVRAQRIQCNRFSGGGVAQAATMSNGSSTITVTDGSKYPVGMPVTFSATANGFTVSQVYMVLSSSGNDITVGNSRSGSAITATNNTAVNILSNGMPNVEIVGAGAGGVTQSTFHHLDLEGYSAGQLYMENVGNCVVDVAEVNTSGNSTNNLVGRTVQYSQIGCTKEAITDFDGGCFTSSFRGVITTHRQRRMHGIYHEFGQTRSGVNLFDNTGTSPDLAALSLTGGGVIQSNRAFTAKVINQVGGAISLDAGRSGVLPVSGAGPHTLTLPTITNATPQTSMIGLTFDIVNISNGVAVTVNTDGTQVFNGQAAATSISIPAGSSQRIVAISTTSWATF